jgi:hypothetical protein
MKYYINLISCISSSFLLAGCLTQTEPPYSLDLTYARNADIGMAYSIYSPSYAEALSAGHSNKHTSPSV